MSTSYTAKDITVLDGIEGIRQRPGMYIGGTDEDAVKHCVLEIISNSVDEALNGYGNIIDIAINTKKNEVTVGDKGRGIPFDEMEDGTPAVIKIFTNIHAGGKFGQGNYGTSGGLNGVGGTAVSAVSEYLTVTSTRDGEMSKTVFKKGRPTDFSVEGTSNGQGTIITFKLDKSIFPSIVIPIEKLRNQIQVLSYLTKGVTFNFVVDGKKEVFLSKEGIKDMIKDCSKDAITDIYYIRKEVDIYDIEIAMQYTKSSVERIFAFANNIPNPDGGTHTTGFKTGLTQNLNKIAIKKELIKENMNGDFVRKGVLAAVSVKMKATPQFASQTKNKLTTPEVRGKVQTITSELIETITNKDLEKIIEKAQKEVKAEAAAQRARDAIKEIVKGGKKAKGIDMPSKLVDATGKGYRELFIVEGDSAGTGLVEMRDPTTQGVLKLRGKPLNTYNKEIGDIIKNREVKDIFTALGCGAGEDVNMKNLRYDKVIISSDSDEDGAHIAILINALFLAHMQPLIEEGHVYFVDAPLFKVTTNKEVKYFYSQKEFDKYKGGGVVDRLKGLGSMEKEDVSKTLLDNKTRRLEQLTTNDIEKTKKLFETLIGKNLGERKQLVIDGTEESEDYDEYR